MAANRFNIPVWDPMLTTWAQNVNARNDAKSRDRQAEWNKIYDMAAAYGERRRAEEEAEKAREFQAEEAAKNRQFQAAENAFNRKLQEQNNAAMINKSKIDNLGKAQAEIGVLDAELNKELGVGGLTEKDKQNITSLYEAKKNNVYARYGLNRPEGTPIPFKPVGNQTQVAIPEPQEDLGQTASQEKFDFEQVKKDMDAKRELIKQMKNGPEKAAAMEQYNKDSDGKFGGYTTDEIKKAGYVPPTIPFKAGVDVPATDFSDEWYSKYPNYRFIYDSNTDTYKPVKK